MRLGPVAILLTLSLLPTVAAQVPTPPAPEDALLLACDIAGGLEPQARDLLPCPQVDPAAPAQHDHAVPPPPPAAPEPSPEDAARLADDIATRVQEIPEEPASAPDELLEIIMLVVEFAKAVLAVPADALAAVQDVAAEAQAALADGKETAASVMKGAATDALEAIKSLLDRSHASPPSVTRTPASLPVKSPSVGLPLESLRQALGEVG